MSRNSERLRDGATIRVHSADHRVVFDVFCIHVNQAADPILLELQFRAILPADLVMPELAPQRLARYETRMFPGSDGQFGVVDLRTGKHLRDNPLRRSDADQLAANLERAGLLGEGEAMAGSFVRSLQPGDTQLGVAMREADERAAHAKALGKPRGRGRPRKSARAVEPAPEAPPMAAAEAE